MEKPAREGIVLLVVVALIVAALVLIVAVELLPPPPSVPTPTQPYFLGGPESLPRLDR